MSANPERSTVAPGWPVQRWSAQAIVRRIRETWRRFRLGRQRRAILRSSTFDPQWYLKRHRDVAAAGVDPAGHYLEAGYQIYFPNPIFDSEWYARRYDCQGRNPLIDYLRGGRGDPNAWFDAAWYARTYLRRRSVDPMLHYLFGGSRNGCQPSPVFERLDRDLGLTRLATESADRQTPLGFFMHNYRVRGWIGDCTSFFVNGWAGRGSGPPIVVAVLVNGIEQGRVAPWIPRPDVLEAHGIAGQGFFFRFPQRLRHGDIVELQDEFGHTLTQCLRTYCVPSLNTPADMFGRRAALAATFLGGSGVEVGAFTQPCDLPPDRDVVFFDRYDGQQLRDSYEPDCGRPLMEPTYVGKADTLDALPDGAFDFLIANHVIEHLQDPIAFLKAVACKLKAGGRAMIAAPDKRYSFDRDRAITDFAHLVDEHENGAEGNQLAHFAEWATAVLGLSGTAAIDHARSMDRDTLLFHFHVWDAPSFVAFVAAAVDLYALPFALLHSESTVHEVTVILEKPSVS